MTHTPSGAAGGTLLDAVGVRAARLGTSSQRRALLAFAAASVTYAAAAGGLFIVAPVWQSALLAALVSALIAPGRILTSAAAFAAVVIGVLLPHPFQWYAGYWPDGSQAVVVALVTGAVAAGTAVVLKVLAARATGWGPKALVVAAYGLLLGNMWYTTWTIADTPLSDERGDRPPLVELIEGRVPEYLTTSDEYFYTQVLVRVNAGEQYYDAFATAFREFADTGEAPATVINVRPPWLTWSFAALGSGAAIIFGLLVLSTAGVIMAGAVTAGVVRRPLMVPMAAVMTALFMLSLVQFGILYAERWAGPLGLIGVACAVRALDAVSRSSGGRGWWVTAVAVLGVATLVREFLVIALLAVGIAAFISDRDRVFRRVTWGASTVIVGLLYVWHFVQASRVIQHADGAGGLVFGGLANVIAALSSSGEFLGGATAAVLLGAAGLAGVALSPSRLTRLIGIVAAAVPFAVFFFVGNGAIDPATGDPTNYWGLAFLPMLYAFIPVAFAILPEARRGDR